MSSKTFLERLLEGAEVEWVPLGKLGKFIRGNGLQKKDLIEAGHPAIHYGQIHTQYELSAGKAISSISFDLAKRLRKAKKNDLLLATTSEDDEDVAKPLAWLGDDVAISGDMMLFRHAQNVQYLSYFIHTPAFQRQKLRYITGAKVRRISSRNLERISVPIPCPENPEKSLAIQAEIVRILDTLSALTSELTSELNKRQKQYNYYRDLLLNFEKDEVEWKALGEIGTWYGGGTPSKRRPDYWEGGTIPWVSPKDMGRSVINSSIDSITPLALKESSAKLVPKSSVLMVVRSSILERVFPSAFVPIEVSINQDMKAIIPHEGILPKYLAHLVSSRGNAILRAARRTGGSVASIDSRKLFTFRIPVPGLEEQARIVAILDQFDTLTQSLTEGLPREIELRQKQYEYYRDLLFDFPRPESARAAAEA